MRVKSNLWRVWAYKCATCHKFKCWTWSERDGGTGEERMRKRKRERKRDERRDFRVLKGTNDIVWGIRGFTRGASSSNSREGTTIYFDENTLRISRKS